MEPQLSWLEKLSLVQSTPNPTGRRKVNPWRLRLGGIRGKIDPSDGIERISCQLLYAALELPRSERNVRVYRQVRATMVELGWEPIMKYGLTLGRKHQVRGYQRRPRWKP
jgi:hypothetical protein